jgi:hypothetical protein
MTAAMLREAFLNAFDNLGGEEWLVAQASKDPRTFVRGVAKRLPRETTAKVTKETPYAPARARARANIYGRALKRCRSGRGSFWTR